MIFSIVVPCYNVEQYLDECIQSIVNQSFRDFEILLVDDGSKDSTGVLCDQWGKKDNRVKVFHKENGGLSDARNFGIDRAQGEYIVFIDSDDYIDTKGLENIKDVFGEKDEVVITRLVETYPNISYSRDDILASSQKCEWERTQAIDWVMGKSYNTWPAQKYIVAKKFLNKNNLRFRKGVLHEDVDWTTRLLCLATRYRVCAYPWYYHRLQREGAITNNVNSKRIISVLEISSDLVYGVDSPVQKLDKQNQKKIVNRIMASVYASIHLYGKLDEKGKLEVQNSIRENYALFDNADKLKYKIFSLMLRLIGVRGVCKIIDIASKANL